MPQRKNKTRVLTVTLNPSLDTILLYKKAGKVYQLSKTSTFGAGKGINVSRTLKAFGVQSIAAGFCGGGNGRNLKKLLQKENLRHQFTNIDATSRNNVSISLSDRRITKRIFQQSPAITPHEYHKFIKSYKQLLRTSNLVIISGSSIRGVKNDVYAQLVKMAHQQNIKVCLDSSGPAYKKGILAKPWMIKPNHNEVNELLNINIRHLTDGLKAVRKFRHMGIENVLISLGANGAICCNQNDLWYAKAPKVKCISSVGCGDAFVGAFCFAQINNLEIPDSFRLAVAAGSVNATSLIPGGIHPNNVRQLATTIKIKQLRV